MSTRPAKSENWTRSNNNIAFSLLGVGVPPEVQLQVPEQLVVLGHEQRHGEGQQLPALHEHEGRRVGLAVQRVGRALAGRVVADRALVRGGRRVRILGEGDDGLRLVASGWG